MKASFSNSYPKRSKNGNVVDVFVYHVNGTESELADYKTVKDDQYREDSVSGKPLFFSLNYVGEIVDLIITTNGNVVADTSKLRKAANLVNQYDFLKDQLASQLLAQIGFNSPNRVNVNTNTPVVTENAGSIDPFNE
jgi:hypothetical protein